MLENNYYSDNSADRKKVKAVAGAEEINVQ